MYIFAGILAVAIFVVISLQTDVVVNSVGTDLKFGVGPLCVALLGKAGPALKAQFDIAVQSQAAGPGSVLCTSGCDMACKSMFHAILPKWKGGQTEKVYFNYYSPLSFPAAYLFGICPEITGINLVNLDYLTPFSSVGVNLKMP